MKYNNIAKQIEQEQSHYCENSKRYIMDGSESRLKEYSTETRWNQYKTGKITLDELKKFAMDRAEKNSAKKTELLKEYISRIENAGTVESIRIRVEWRRSRTWPAAL